MARRKKIKHTVATKIAAVEEVKNGAKHADVAAKYNIVDSLLRTWRTKHAAGEYAKKQSNGHAPVKAREHVPASMTPERVFDDRVREAIALLRRADKEVERLKNKGTIKEPDSAHLYAGLALRILQGDNGT